VKRSEGVPQGIPIRVEKDANAEEDDGGESRGDQAVPRRSRARTMSGRERPAALQIRLPPSSYDSARTDDKEHPSGTISPEAALLGTSPTPRSIWRPAKAWWGDSENAAECGSLSVCTPRKVSLKQIAVVLSTDEFP